MADGKAQNAEGDLRSIMAHVSMCILKSALHGAGYGETDDC